MEELVDLMLHLSIWLDEIWPSHLEFVHVVVGDRFVKISDFVDEGSFLDVGSGNRFVPFVVKSIDSGGDFSNVNHESVDLSHLLHVGVTFVIDDDEQLEEVEERGEEGDSVVIHSVLESGLEHALFWVLEAPVLHIVTNSLELALFGILEDGVNDSINGTLSLLEVNGPEVIVHLVLDSPGGGEGWLSPITEALSGDDIGIRLVESLKESSIDIFIELSVGLDMVELLSGVLWAAWVLFQHSPKWLVGHVACLNSD